MDIHFALRRARTNLKSADFLLISGQNGRFSKLVKKDQVRGAGKIYYDFSAKIHPRKAKPYEGVF